MSNLKIFNNKLPLNYLRSICFSALFIICFTSASSGSPSVGDRAEIRVWYNRSNSGGGKGLSGGLELKSIENIAGGALCFKYVLDNGSNGGKCPFPMPPEGFTIGIQYTDYKPQVVTFGSSRLVNGPWVTGISTNFGFSGSAELYFPVLRQGQKYEESDWYQIRLNDTITIYCKYDSEKKAFTGTVKKIIDRDESDSETIISGDKYAVYTNDSPLRIAMVVIHSSVTHLVNKEFTGLGEGYYGFTIGAYRSGYMIRNVDRKKGNSTDSKFDSRGRRTK